MPILSGTFTTVQGNAAVTATGATLVGQIFAGDLVSFSTFSSDAQGSYDKLYEVKTDPISDSSLTLSTAYNETGASSLKCWYWPTSGSRTARLPSVLSTQVTNLLNRYGSVLTAGGADQRVTLTKTSSGDYAETKFVQGSTEYWRNGMSADNDWALSAKINAAWTDVLRLTSSGSSPNQIVTASVKQPLAISHSWALAGIITPSQITADQNNYSPTGLSSANVLRLSSDAARTITGLALGGEGRIITLENVGSFTITLSSQNASSTAANRFSFGSDIYLIPNQVHTLKYDATASRWRLFAGTARAFLYGSASDKYLYTTAANTWAEGSITSAARGVLASSTMTVSSSKIGINATAQTYLDVRGPYSDTVTFDETASTAILRVRGTNASNKLEIGAGGASMGYRLWVQGGYDNGGGLNGAKDILMQPGGGYLGVGLATAPSAVLHTVTSTRHAHLGAGAVQSDASGNLSVSSDERLKHIDGQFTRSIEALRSLAPIVYRWNELSGMDQINSYVGFSAQNVQASIPEAVGSDDKGFLTLSDRALLATVVNAIKNIDARLTAAGF